jgi:hypothetical protein
MEHGLVSSICEMQRFSELTIYIKKFDIENWGFEPPSDSDTEPSIDTLDRYATRVLLVYARYMYIS